MSGQLKRDSSWPADLDRRAFEDMAGDGAHMPKPKPARTEIPTGARRVVRIDGKPTRQRVMTLRPMTANERLEVERSESEGRYERLLVAQAIRAVGGEIR